MSKSERVFALSNHCPVFTPVFTVVAANTPLTYTETVLPLLSNSTMYFVLAVTAVSTSNANVVAPVATINLILFVVIINI